MARNMSSEISSNGRRKPQKQASERGVRQSNIGENNGGVGSSAISISGNGNMAIKKNANQAK